VGVAEDLELLEKSIRQLQIEWEKFFGGVEKRPPNDLQKKVERMVRQFGYGESQSSNPTERFRAQTQVARFNTFNELWNKKLRALEEGKPLGVHGLKADQLPPPRPRAAEPPGPAAPRVPGEVRIDSPDQDAAAVRVLYESFAAARQATGEGIVKFESFQKLIAQQAARILEQKGARAVDFRIEAKDGKVSLKAKPVK
jgi:hypothetical protein